MDNRDYMRKMAKIPEERKLLSEAVASILAFATVNRLPYDTAFDIFVTLLHAELQQDIDSGKADELRAEGEKISKLLDELIAILER